jgi:hypothetical protein
MTANREFQLDAPDELQDFFRDIATEMTLSFGISRAEAVARINWHWRGRQFAPRNDLVLHAPPSHWAITIFYEEVFEDGRLRRRTRPTPSRDSGCW